jgi:hypothetical protein
MAGGVAVGVRAAGAGDGSSLIVPADFINRNIHREITIRLEAG